MDNINRVRAVMFDMDGVIYNSMPNHATSWHRAMTSFGLQMSPEDAYLYEGMRGVETIKLLAKAQWGKDLTDKEAAEMYAVKSAYYAACPAAQKMPGVEDLMRKIKAMWAQIVVVTGSGQQTLLDRLAADLEGLVSPDMIVSAKDVTHGKPNPEPYLAGIAKANAANKYSVACDEILPEHCVIVENAPLGVRAGVAAGVFTIAVNTGPLPNDTLKAEGAGLILPSMQALADGWEGIVASINSANEQATTSAAEQATVAADEQAIATAAEQAADDLSRYFIHLSYDGTNYHGWQIQPGDDTVQERLQKALSLLLRRETPVTGAGRTDTGVHARHMVAHADLPIGTDCAQLTYKLNSLLPHDIAVSHIIPVDGDMHARYSATARTYHYYLHTQKDPFCRAHSCEHTRPLDFALMNEAAQHLLTVSDFAAFCKSHSDAKTTICHVTEAEWTPDGPHHWHFRITADRFLRNMVRAIVGTLLLVGRQTITPEQFADIIASRQRTAAGESAPACGLFLEEIKY